MVEAVVETPLEERYRHVRRVTLIGSVVDLSLGVGKIAGGWLSHSQALIADGVHSLSDLVTDVLVLYAAKHAHAEADEDHPYGHARIETAATVGLGIALVAIAIGIVSLRWDFGRWPTTSPVTTKSKPWAFAHSQARPTMKDLQSRHGLRFAP